MNALQVNLLTMDSTSIIIVAAIIAAVVVVALARFKLVNFEAMWKGKAGLKLGASNHEPTVQRDISVKELDARQGRLTAKTPQGNMQGEKWTAQTDIDLVAGNLPESSATDPKVRPPSQ
jgi:hypothetical protein